MVAIGQGPLWKTIWKTSQHALQCVTKVEGTLLKRLLRRPKKRVIQNYKKLNIMSGKKRSEEFYNNDGAWLGKF